MWHRRGTKGDRRRGPADIAEDAVSVTRVDDPDQAETGGRGLEAGLSHWPAGQPACPADLGGPPEPGPAATAGGARPPPARAGGPPSFARPAAPRLWPLFRSPPYPTPPGCAIRRPAP